MTQIHLENSPIVYYKCTCNSTQWVLFLHAAFVDHSMFRHQIEYFQNKFNLIAVDILGHGASIRVQKGNRMGHMSGWLEQILLSEHIDKIHVLGISLGSVLAQDFANHFPHRIQSLACFGGYDINNFDTTLQKGNNSAQIKMMAKAICSINWFAEDNKKISAYTEKAQQEFYEMNRKFQRKSFIYLSDLNKMVNVHKPQKRNYPLLIGCGEHDIPMELTAVRMWKDSEVDCRLIIFNDAGHCVNMDVPNRFNEELENFWLQS